jgi:hypothetical protein
MLFSTIFFDCSIAWFHVAVSAASFLVIAVQAQHYYLTVPYNFITVVCLAFPQFIINLPYKANFALLFDPPPADIMIIRAIRKNHDDKTAQKF